MGEKKRTLRGFLCAALGGVCWGASGTVGQYLFTRQGVDTVSYTHLTLPTNSRV